MQNVNPYFDFPPPHCLFTMILLRGSEEDLRVFTGETSNAKAKSSKNFSKSRPKVAKFWWFSGTGVRWYKNFQFLLQKAHPCPNPRRLSHFALLYLEATRNTFYGTRYLSHCYACFAFNPLFINWVTI